METSVRIWQELTDYLRRVKRKGLATRTFDERAAANLLLGAIFADAIGRDTTPDRYPYAMRDGVDRYVQLLLRAIGAPTSDVTTTAGAARQTSATAKSSEK